MKYVTQKTDLPITSHIAILVFSQRYIEGDERSRTNPGHGYPASYENKTEYIAFDSEDELARWIQINQHASFAVFHSTPKKVETRVSVSLS